MFTNLKRYYSNSFTDTEKQNSINLFLGYFRPSKGETPIWNIENDWHLHNEYRQVRRGQRLSTK